MATNNAAMMANVPQHQVGDDPYLKYCSAVAEQMARHAMIGYMHSSETEHANQKVGFEPRLVNIGGYYKFMFEDSAGHSHSIDLANVTGAQKITLLLDAYNTGNQGVDPRAVFAAWQHPEVQKAVHDQVYQSVFSDLASSDNFKNNVYSKLGDTPIEQVFRLPDAYTPPTALPNALDLKTEVEHINSMSADAYKHSVHAMTAQQLGYTFSDNGDATHLRVNLAMLTGVDQTLQNIGSFSFDPHEGLLATLRPAGSSPAAGASRGGSVPVNFMDPSGSSIAAAAAAAAASQAAAAHPATSPAAAAQAQQQAAAAAAAANAAAQHTAQTSGAAGTATAGPKFNFNDVKTYLNGGTIADPQGQGSAGPQSYGGVTYKEYTSTEVVDEIVGYTTKSNPVYDNKGHMISPGSPGGEPIHATHTVTKVHTVREQMLAAFVEKYYDAYCKKTAEIFAKNAMDGYLNYSHNGTTAGTDSRLQADLTKDDHGLYKFTFKDSTGLDYEINLAEEFSPDVAARISKFLDSHLVAGGVMAYDAKSNAAPPSIVDSRAAMAVWKLPEIQQIVHDEIYGNVYDVIKHSDHFKHHAFAKMGFADPTKLFAKPADHYATDITQASAQLQSIMAMDAASLKSLEVAGKQITYDAKGKPVETPLPDPNDPMAAAQTAQMSAAAYGGKGNTAHPAQITPAHYNLEPFPEDQTESLTGNTNAMFSDFNHNKNEDIVRMSLFLLTTPGQLDDDNQIGYDAANGLITGTMNVKENQPDDDWFDSLVPIIVVGFITWGIGAAVSSALEGTTLAAGSTFASTLPQAFITAGLSGLATSAINGTPFSVENLLIGTIMPGITNGISAELRDVLPADFSPDVRNAMARGLSSLAAQALGGQDLSLQNAVLSGTASLVATGVTKMLMPDDLQAEIDKVHGDTSRLPASIRDQIGGYQLLGAEAADIYGYFAREAIADPSKPALWETLANQQAAQQAVANPADYRPKPHDTPIPAGTTPVYDNSGNVQGYRDANGVIHAADYHAPVDMHFKIDPMHTEQDHYAKLAYAQHVPVTNYSGEAFQLEPMLHPEPAGTHYLEHAPVIDLQDHHHHHLDAVHVVFQEPPAMAAGMENLGAGFGHHGYGGHGGGYNGKA